MMVFLQERLVCPISKQPLISSGNGYLIAPCGLKYQNNDFRVGLEYSDKWKIGQGEYEIFEKRWLKSVNSHEKLVDLDRETSDVYSEIKMLGDILDVGGAYGFVIKQAGIDASRYISLDPIDINWDRLNDYQCIDLHYSVCKSAARVRGFAEFLPFADASFDFVHMRSCIDHFANPNLALMEAFRVLRRGGRLVVGVSLGGVYKKNQLGVKEYLKRLASKHPMLLQIIDIFKHDHHMFHPDRASLINLIEKNGFNIVKEVWQQAYHNVIYIEAVRVEELVIS